MVCQNPGFGVFRHSSANEGGTKPLLAFLVVRLGDLPGDDAFGIWIQALIVLNSVSLVIDAVDVARYIAGDREETVAGL